MLLHVIVYQITGRGKGFNNMFEDYGYYDEMDECIYK